VPSDNHANTDGPFDPYSKGYDLLTINKDFPAFQLEKSYQEYARTTAPRSNPLRGFRVGIFGYT